MSESFVEVVFRVGRRAHRIDDPVEKEKAREDLETLTEMLGALRAQITTGKIAAAVVAKAADVASDFGKALADALDAVETDNKAKLRRVVRAMMRLAPVLDLLPVRPEAAFEAETEGSVAYPAEDVYRMCGPIAARVYAYIATHGKASTLDVRDWALSTGIPEERLQAAISCLLRHNLITMFSRMGEVYYSVAQPKA